VDQDHCLIRVRSLIHPGLLVMRRRGLRARPGRKGQQDVTEHRMFSRRVSVSGRYPDDEGHRRTQRSREGERWRSSEKYIDHGQRQSLAD
jgi:hypothetical protein